MSTAIAIQSLVKQYSPGSQPAVDHVTLDIIPGELFFLLGPSGCGKTTLLRMIAGFIDPTSGRILFKKADGAQRDVTHEPPNTRNTGMVFQSYALWPHMTVFDNVAFGLSVRKVEKEETKRRVMDALALVQMDTYAQRKPNALSGGQQQRVALARALVVRPDVLLLDEPLSNLDAKLRIELRTEIRRICKASGITGIYVTHDQKEALSMADRCAVLKAGKVIQLGAPADLYRAPCSAFVASFLGETNFLPGTVTSSDARGSVIATPAGTLHSSRTPPDNTGKVTVSLRPEALRLDGAGGAGVSPAAANTLRGTITDTTYLGELAQHTITLTGTPPIDVRVALLNPARTSPSGPATLTIHPDDVVLVPA